MIDQCVNTNVGTDVVAPGIATITPGSMNAIYVGCLLVVSTGGNQEVITVTGVTTTTLTANFINTHAASEPLTGATFPSGQAQGDQLFTQAEMLAWLADAQNQLLLRTRCIYNVGNIALTADNPYYLPPDHAIRVERISLNGKPLYDTSTSNLDFNTPTWGQQSSGTPKSWYQDRTTDTGKIGFTPAPAVGDTAKAYYSERALKNIKLNSTLLVPDPATIYLKYAVLASAFSQDGEARDDMRASLCQKRFDFGCGLITRYLEVTESGPRRVAQQ